MESIDQELARLRQENVALSEHIDRLRTLNDNLLSQRDTFKAEFETASRQRDEARGQADARQSYIDQLQRENAELGRMGLRDSTELTLLRKAGLRLVAEASHG